MGAERERRMGFYGGGEKRAHGILRCWGKGRRIEPHLFGIGKRVESYGAGRRTVSALRGRGEERGMGAHVVGKKRDAWNLRRIGSMERLMAWFCVRILF